MIRKTANITPHCANEILSMFMLSLQFQKCGKFEEKTHLKTINNKFVKNYIFNLFLINELLIESLRLEPVFYFYFIIEEFDHHLNTVPLLSRQFIIKL